MKLVWFLRIWAILLFFQNISINLIQGDSSLDPLFFFAIVLGGFLPSIILWWLSSLRQKRVKRNG